MNNIIFATANPHKVDEVRRMNPSFRFKSLSELDQIEEIPETGDTFMENALQKAQYVYDRFKSPTLAEDSGLVIPSLGGAPGVRSARFVEGRRDPVKNIQKVLRLLSTFDDRRAHFVSTFCFIDTHGRAHFFEGFCHGYIQSSIEGKGGFGYDPIFRPEGFEHSFGVLPPEVKDSISHRKKSLILFSEYLASQ